MLYARADDQNTNRHLVYTMSILFTDNFLCSDRKLMWKTIHGFMFGFGLLDYKKLLKTNIVNKLVQNPI